MTERHILSISGGKDSTALAIHMRDKIPNVEYVFMDTGEELPETYTYLDRLEAFLASPIVRLKNKRYGFSDLLRMRNGFLPSPQARWCTEQLKIKPFEEYVGDAPVVSYIAIRADEKSRIGYVSTKSNIRPVYPFIDAGIDLAGVKRILGSSGVGLPDYYSWRSRSGCYFCFFQRRIEWVGLLNNHPDLFRKAAEFEKTDPLSGESYTWNSRESLIDLSRPERVEEILNNSTTRPAKQARSTALLELLRDDCEPDDVADGCYICHL